MTNAFLNSTSDLSQSDPEIAAVLRAELARQRNHLELIASENIVSEAVLQAQGSVLTNKYAEGYVGKRYYGGCEEVDVAESLAIDRAKELFSAGYVNVQPHSGSQANQAAFFALLQPGDTILGMDLNCGGHLTHGMKINMSGKWFKVAAYGVDPKTHAINYDEVLALALEHKPKVIIAGYSAYYHTLDFQKFRTIADEVGAYLMVDMAHFSGLVAAGYHPNPLPYADVVTTTTHKTLRGPRGGMLLSNNEKLYKALNSALFPGIQGGPLLHVIAAKAVAFKEALDPSFKVYIKNVLANIQVLGRVLQDAGYALIGGGTVNHMLLVDLRPHGLQGSLAEKALEKAGIVVNKNSLPFDTAPPTITSGIRIGSPAMTTRGMGAAEFETIGHLMIEVLESLKTGKEHQVLQSVEALCGRFPIYPGL